ncbi:hypothetical protein E8E13_006104 [Curvularia kusanoi]|uniref:Uncharacterized protein n=1 Tax=Curvularia kusanoi TaxID=90978 RepID=A0A9P4TA14_CURKU|nr:hypothetical protein E8E13_006104 [Curvularia kusanoi]
MAFGNTHTYASGCTAHRILGTTVMDTLLEEEFVDNVSTGNDHESVASRLSDDGSDEDNESDWTEESSSNEESDPDEKGGRNDKNERKDENDGNNSNNRRDTGIDKSDPFSHTAYRLRAILVCLVTGIVMAAVSFYIQKMLTVNLSQGIIHA